MSVVLPFFACYVIGDYLFVKVVSHMLILIFRKIFQDFFRHPDGFCYVYSRGMKSSRNCTALIIFPDQPAAGRFYGGGDGSWIRLSSSNWVSGSW